MAKGQGTIVGLDIGTTKICAVVGQQTSEGVQIVGIGSSPSFGVRSGVVVNIDRTVQAIRKAIDGAEFMAGCKIESVHVGIAGTHVKGENSTGVVAIKNREIMSADIERVIDAAQAIALPYDREILHVIPQEFIVDDQRGIIDPLGMSGVRLEAKVHIITAASTALRNIQKCCEKAGLYVETFSLESLASSRAVLYPDERELGVAVIDMGGGTSDIAIYHGGSVRYTAVVGLGGNHITNDISVGLRTSLEDAEKIKKTYGCALADKIDRSQEIRIAPVGGQGSRRIDPYLLGQIIEARVEEMLTIIDWELTRSGYGDQLHAGIVLTGGGALLPGIKELAEAVFDLPVRIGVPYGFSGLKDVVNNPIFSTAAGLVLANVEGDESGIYKDIAPRGESWLGSWFISFVKRIRDWFGEF